MFETRLGIAALDRLFGSVIVGVPSAGFVSLAWDKQSQSVGVMGVLDDEGAVLDVPPELLNGWTSMLPKPFPPDVWRLAFPSEGAHLSGAVVVQASVHEPAWARTLDWVSSTIEAGFRTRLSDARDAVWVTLEAAGLPSGSVLLSRVVLFPDSPDELMFRPERLFEMGEGRGASLLWSDAAAGFPLPQIEPALASCLNELGVAAEADAARSGSQVIADVMVTL